MRNVSIIVLVNELVCEACGTVVDPIVFEARQNDRMLPDIEPTRLVATSTGYPDGWKRIDVLNESNYTNSKLHCPSCAAIVSGRVREAIQQAHWLIKNPSTARN